MSKALWTAQLSLLCTAETLTASFPGFSVNHHIPNMSSTQWEVNVVWNGTGDIIPLTHNSSDLIWWEEEEQTVFILFSQLSLSLCPSQDIVLGNSQLNQWPALSTFSSISRAPFPAHINLTEMTQLLPFSLAPQCSHGNWRTMQGESFVLWENNDTLSRFSCHSQMHQRSTSYYKNLKYKL